MFNRMPILRCDCSNQLAAAMRMIENEDLGVVLYLRQRHRAPQPVESSLQDKGADTVETNEILGFKAVQIMVLARNPADLGLSCLLTNNPRKIVGLSGYGLEVVERVPIEIILIRQHKYLKTKKEKLGHLFVHNISCKYR